MTSHPEELNDAGLVQLTANGDPRAFTELFCKYSTLVFSIALKILADREEASDVLQMVFLKLHRKAALYCPELGNPATWLAVMAKNQSLDKLRQIKSRRILTERLLVEASAAADSSNGGEGHARYRDEVNLLHGAMATLRQDEVRVLRLAYFSGLTQQEISSQLAEPLGTVKSRIRRALGKLRTALESVVQRPVVSPVVPQMGNGVSVQGGTKSPSPLLSRRATEPAT